MPDGQVTTQEQSRTALKNWLLGSLPVSDVERILGDQNLYTYYSQLLAAYVASGQLDIQTLLQTAPSSETQAATSGLSEAQSNLSNWLLKQYKDQYLPWQIANEGLTEDEANILYGELRDELFPKVPQTQDEKLAWYQKNIGQAPPYTLDKSGNMTVDWSAIDSVIATKGAQPTPVTQTKQYRDFAGWRESQLSEQDKLVSQQQESQARQKLIQAAQVASDYGIPQLAIQGLAPEMADQWMQAQWQTQMARSEQWQKQEAQRRADITTAQTEAESRRIAAQQEQQRQSEIQRVGARLQERLLPMPDTTQSYQEAVSKLVSPAMRQFYKGKESEIFAGAGMEDAMLQWWKMLNEPVVEEAEFQISHLGGYGVSAAGVAEEFGIPYGAAVSTAQRYLADPTATEFATLPEGGRTALEQAVAGARADEEQAQQISSGISRAQELARQPNPWEKYLGGRDWFTEFFTTPRAFRTGGYTQRSLAPSIRRY